MWRWTYSNAARRSEAAAASDDKLFVRSLAELDVSRCAQTRATILDNLQSPEWTVFTRVFKGRT